MRYVLDYELRDYVGRLVGWLSGFEESELYKDYREAEGFTDEEFAGVMVLLRSFAEGVPVLVSSP